MLGNILVSAVGAVFCAGVVELVVFLIIRFVFLKHIEKKVGFFERSEVEACMNKKGITNAIIHTFGVVSVVVAFFVILFQYI